MLKTSHPSDPRGLIFESYRIDGISAPECRAIFFDWAFGVPEGDDVNEHIMALIVSYSHGNPEHPMTEILKAGLNSVQIPKRRGGRNRTG